MLYTIAEASELSGLSKVSIYKRIKLKEMQPYITKKQGKTYIDDVFLSLLQEELKNTDRVKSCLKNEAPGETEKQVTAGINSELINLLKEELRVKNDQIKELTQRLAAQQELMKNMQVLQLKQPQEQEVEIVEAPGADQQEGQQEEQKPKQEKRKWFGFGRMK